jgi:hypothetical protein
VLCRLLVVSGQWLVGVVRNPATQDVEIEDAQQRVAAPDIGVEEAKRLARLDRFDPERDLGQLDRHRIAVNGVEAGTRDVAQRVSEIIGGGDAARPCACQPRRDAPSGREQERAARRQYWCVSSACRGSGITVPSASKTLSVGL